jgi:adenosyl cobinamide kinase/adenosyl cobinamide phosphate guanylyltransferase
MSGNIHLLIGGARSGKSKRAQELAARYSTGVTYIATCLTDGLDSEMRARIERHRSDRPPTWTTVENQFDLVEVINQSGGSIFLLDCLTLWLAYWQSKGVGERDILVSLETALQHARVRNTSLFIVSNELGMGLVPLEPENRNFRDLCGRANQIVASLADHVELLVAGLPLKLK